MGRQFLEVGGKIINSMITASLTASIE